MTTFPKLLQEQLLAAFTKAGHSLPDGFQPQISQATDSRFGHYQSNAAMVLAKALRSNPRALRNRSSQNLMALVCARPRPWLVRVLSISP